MQQYLWEFYICGNISSAGSILSLGILYLWELFIQAGLPGVVCLPDSASTSYIPRVFKRGFTGSPKCSIIWSQRTPGLVPPIMLYLLACNTWYRHPKSRLKINFEGTWYTHQVIYLQMCFLPSTLFVRPSFRELLGWKEPWWVRGNTEWRCLLSKGSSRPYFLLTSLLIKILSQLALAIFNRCVQWVSTWELSDTDCRVYSLGG